MDLNELVKQVGLDLKKKEEMSVLDISYNAFKQIKGMKKELPDIFLKHRNRDRRVIFMAGSPGAGKSEMAYRLQEKYKIDIIDTDEIRKICDGYCGSNSHLFQKASSKGVSILTDYAFKNSISFILDGNFSEYDIQKQNIDRALAKEYYIEIDFVYRPLELAKNYTIHREELEGRKVPSEVFVKKSLGAIETVEKFIDTVRVNFFDVVNKKVIEDISKADFLDKTKEMQEVLIGEMETNRDETVAISKDLYDRIVAEIEKQKVINKQKN